METVMGSLLGRKFLGHSTVVDGQLEGASSMFCDVLEPDMRRQDGVYERQEEYIIWVANLPESTVYSMVR